MIEGLKPYGEYKESSLPWLGRCPSHWELRRTKVLFQERVQKGYPDEPLLAATQLKGVVRKERYETRTVTAQKDLHLLKLVDVGDYVISLRSFQGGIEVAYDRGIISPAYTVLRPKPDAASGYYTHFFKSKPFVDSLTLFVTGIREGQNIEYPRLSRAAIPLPPATEQAAIVRFLDHANRKIDRFIRAKKKTIALLNEQKQVIIHRAVTRGLDPNVKLKPSGIDWLGDIPVHWEVARSRRLFTARKEFAWEDDVQLSATQAYGVIPQEEYERRVGRRVVKICMHLEKRKHVEPDDFVMSMRSFQGGLERAWARGAIRSSYIILKPSTNVDVDFFSYLFKSFGYIRALQVTGNFIRDGQDLNESNFRGVDLPLIPMEEQRAIAEYLTEAVSELVKKTERIQREIDLMQEYRTRLTADIVTGKLDVREAAAKLPDLEEDAEPEALDDLPDDELMDDEDLGEEA